MQADLWKDLGVNWVKFGQWARDWEKQAAVKQGAVKQGAVKEWIGWIF